MPRGVTLAAMALLALPALSACGEATDALSCPEFGPRPSLNPSPEPAPKVMPPISKFDRRYAAWLHSPSVTTLDLSTVPRAEDFADGPSALPTYNCAVDRADVIAVGTVERVQFIPERALLDFRVERVAKGSASGVLSVMQFSYLYPEKGDFPTGPFGAPRIIDHPGGPLLIPGERVLLFLERTRIGRGNTRLSPEVDPDEVRYGIQREGIYRIVGGRAQALPTNPIADLTGRSEKELLDRAASRAASAPA